MVILIDDEQRENKGITEGSASVINKGDFQARSIAQLSAM